MALAICTFASGSSGNSYLVETDNTVLLVDAGITGKRIKAGLASRGLTPADIDGILITHEHTDHVKSVKMMAKEACNASVWSSPGTLMAIENKVASEKLRAFSCEDGPFHIGDIEVHPFRLSHDAAEPVGYSFVYGGKRAAIVTDTGCVTESIFSEIVNADLLVLEANHEKNVLLMGGYPYSLKQRILGDKGHISNDQTADCMIRILRERENPNVPFIALAHLSGENNSPGMAYLTVKNRLFDEDLFEGRDYRLTVLVRDEFVEPIEV